MNPRPMWLPGLWLALIAVCAIGTAAAATQAVFADDFGAPGTTLAAGGGNYLWFADRGECSVASRDAYGLLKRYHEVDARFGPVRALARRQLAAMYKGGMRRLSLGVYFMHEAPASGTLVDSTDPAQVARVVQNLALLLQDVRAAGFEDVLFRFFPTNNINPSQPEFPHRDSAQFQQRVDEYWNLVQQMRPVLVASRLAYRIDLMVEGAPRDSNNVVIPEGERYKYPANIGWSRAVRTLWQRYRSMFGTSDTIGFSFLVDADRNRLRSRVRHMRYVYEGVYPDVFAMDFYAGVEWDERDKFRAMDALMREQNPAGASWHEASWIIAEAYYEDPLAAEALSGAIRETGRRVLYLTQWPLDRAGTCPDDHVNVAPPQRWRIWQAYGF